MVDDDVRLAGALRRGLEHEGYAVDVARTGEEGRWFATEQTYDVLVLDSTLPGLSGEDLCVDLRSAGDWTPILMLTAKTGAADVASALDCGADDFLSKPFSYVVLLARLRALVRRGRPERPAVLRAGDLTLDPARHQVARGDAPVVVTPRQFAVLEFLMRRAGQVVSKRELLEHVWDFGFDGDPNIVEVYVHQLRARIDQPFGRNALRTVRGAGYLLDADGG